MYQQFQHLVAQIGASYPSNINNLIYTCPEISSSPMDIINMCMCQQAINGQNELCLRCSFRHQCPWQNAQYSFPMEMFVPRSFPMVSPELYIRPEAGSRIFAIPNVIDESGKVIFYLVQNLRGGYSLSQLFTELHKAFGNVFPICADHRPEMIKICLSTMEPEFLAKYQTLLASYQSFMDYKEKLDQEVDYLSTASNTLVSSEESLTKRDKTINQSLEKLKKIEDMVKDGVVLIEQDYTLAFSFGSDDQRLCIELEVYEKACRDLHDLLYSSLSKTNTEEVIDLIRENGKQIFEALYLKEVVKARTGTKATCESNLPFLPMAPVLPSVGRSMY